MSKWRDETRHGKIIGSDKKVGKLTISVHHYWGYPKETWFVSCSPFFTKRELASGSLGQAKCQASALVQVEAEKVISDIVVD
jgi:hypothetical protein